MTTTLFFLTLWLPMAAPFNLHWLTPTEFDFGEVGYGQLDATFRFRNDGTDTVQIDIVRPKTACDCSWAEWDEGPIAPGRMANIKVHHNPKSGAFKERYSVWFHRQRKPVKLYIEGYATD